MKVKIQGTMGAYKGRSDLDSGQGRLGSKPGEMCSRKRKAHANE